MWLLSSRYCRQQKPSRLFPIPAGDEPCSPRRCGRSLAFPEDARTRARVALKMAVFAHQAHSFLKKARGWAQGGRAACSRGPFRCPRRTKQLSRGTRRLFGLRLHPFSPCCSPPGRCPSFASQGRPAPHAFPPVSPAAEAALALRSRAVSQLDGKGFPRAFFMPVLLKFLVTFSPDEGWDCGELGWGWVVFGWAIYRAGRRNRGVYPHILGEKMAICVKASQILFSIPPVSHRLQRPCERCRQQENFPGVGRLPLNHYTSETFG